MNRFLNAQEFAEYLSVHPTTITKYLNAGMPAIRGKNLVKIEPEEAIAWLKVNLRRVSQRRNRRAKKSCAVSKSTGQMIEIDQDSLADHHGHANNQLSQEK